MLSFNQLQEKKTKIKINPKKDEIVEGQKKKKDDSYLETNMKKRQDNNEKARKELAKGPQMKNPHFESTNQEESAYDSQEEVSEESNQKIEAETEIPFLTFDQYQHAKTLDEEQLNEFLGTVAKTTKNIFNNPAAVTGKVDAPGESKPPPNPLAGVMNSPSNGSFKGAKFSFGKSGLTAKLSSGNTAKTPKVQDKLGSKVKKEEVEQTNENILSALFGGGKKPTGGTASQTAVGKMQQSARQGNLMGSGMIANTAQKMMARRDQQAAMMKKLGYSKGGKVKKEEVENIEEMDAGLSKMVMKSAGKGPVGNALRGGVKPGGSNPLGVKSAATSAGGGLTYTNNARLLARAPAQYTRGNVPQPPKTAPKVDSSANAVSRPGMGSSNNRKSSTSTGPKPNRPVTASNALRSKPKREHHIRSFGSFLNERTRYAKETGKDPQTGNPSEKGGTIKPGSAMSKVRKSLAGQGLMSSRKKAIQPQGKKKEKGKKGYEGPTPVDKIKNKLSKERAPKKDPYGYGSGRYQGD